MWLGGAKLSQISRNIVNGRLICYAFPARKLVRAHFFSLVYSYQSPSNQKETWKKVNRFPTFHMGWQAIAWPLLRNHNLGASFKKGTVFENGVIFATRNIPLMNSLGKPVFLTRRKLWN